MRVAFFGTSEFGADALELLHQTPGITITAVVTQPDRRKGRGRATSPPPVADRARALGLDADPDR